MTIELRPGDIKLAELEQIYRQGSAITLGEQLRTRVDQASSVVAQGRIRIRSGLWRQHRLRQACQQAHTG